MKKFNLWGPAALILAFFIFVIAAITAIMDSSTFLNRIQTTIIAWQLPLVTMGLIILSLYEAKREEGSHIITIIINVVAIALMTVALLVTNLSKNAVQDVASNAKNLVDVAAELIEDEAPNVREYQKIIERAAEDAEEVIEKQSNRNRGRDYDDYDEYDW